MVNSFLLWGGGEEVSTLATLVILKLYALCLFETCYALSKESERELFSSLLSTDLRYGNFIGKDYTHIHTEIFSYYSGYINYLLLQNKLPQRGDLRQ